MPDRSSPPTPPWSEHRMRRRRDFLRTYAHGRKAHGRFMVLFACEQAEPGTWRLGLTTTRKLGKAVKRNRLRRLGRELFRAREKALPNGVDFVLNFKRSALEADYHQLAEDLDKCLRRLGSPPRSQAVEDRGRPRS